MKIQYEFFLRDLAVCIKTKIIFYLFYYYFFFFFTKTRYLIPDLYLYSIKIQTDIDQNAVKYLRKITDFLKECFLKNVFFRAGPNPAHVAGLDQATRAWSLAQASDPNKLCTRKILRVHGIALFMLVFADSKNEPLV
jgi:hypothetical protein